MSRLSRISIVAALLVAFLCAVATEADAKRRKRRRRGKRSPATQTVNPPKSDPIPEMQPSESVPNSPSTTQVESGTQVIEAATLASPAATGSREVDSGREGLSEAVGLTYMLWNISGLGLNEGTSRSLERMLLGELRKLLGARLLSAEPWIDFETRREVDVCGGTTECLAEAGGALGADRVIMGVAASLGDAYSLNLKLVDARKARTISRANSSLEGERDRILEAMQLLVFKLIDPGLLVGSLTIETDLAGAEVYIDGEHVGQTPLPGPVEKLLSGEHSLKITAPLIKDYFKFFTIHHGKTAKITVDAEEIKTLQAELEVAENMATPIYKRWWFWTVVSGVVAAAAGGTVFGIMSDGEPRISPPSGSLGTADVRR